MQLDECSKNIGVVREQNQGPGPGQGSENQGGVQRERGGDERVQAESPSERSIDDEGEGEEGCATALNHLMSERQNVVDYVKGLLEQREQLQMLTENFSMGFDASSSVADLRDASRLECCQMFFHYMFSFVEGEECFTGHLCCRCCYPEHRRSSIGNAVLRAAAA